jgi:NADH-quinone oxidoreductase subunit L
VSGAAGAARAFTIPVALRLDPLTATLLAIITCIGLVVAVYSVGYMHHDPGYPRFFAVFSLFVFSMSMLVAASNFLVVYVFWEAVGACSYLLIGFWFTKPEAARAAKKAFLVNRVGDCRHARRTAYPTSGRRSELYPQRRSVGHRPGCWRLQPAGLLREVG